MGIVKAAIIDSLGFDVDEPLMAGSAAAFKAMNFDFCIRYIPRTSALAKGNLTLSEIGIILDAGLSLSAVQHCPEPGWQPTAALGTQYGQYAGQYAAEIGLPPGINIWLDLEMVAPTAKADDIIAYCENWYDQVGLHGYIPAVYIGYQTGLTDTQLYENLSFKHYWRAYNCDQSIPTRGYQITQFPAKTLNGISFDPNIVKSDNLGSLPIFVFPS